MCICELGVSCLLPCFASHNKLDHPPKTKECALIKAGPLEHQGYFAYVLFLFLPRLFSRAWCVAELVEAYNSHLEQHVMLHSPEVLEQHSRELCSLHVEDCSASRAEDKEAILAKIGEEAEIATFNARLQSLLLGSEGLLAGWLDGQKILQEVGAIAARAKARSRIQESGEVLTI